MRSAHEVEYKVYGDDLQFVEIMLEPGGDDRSRSRGDDVYGSID